MPTSDIAAMGPRVRSLVHPDGAHLWIWVTNNFLFPDAGEVLHAWRATYITTITWAKTDGYGTGQYARGETEHLLLCRWGQPGYKTAPLREGLPPHLLQLADGRCQTRTLIHAPRPCIPGTNRPKHSAKPEIFREIVEWMSPGPRLEMFARTAPAGWDVWGNEVVKDVELADDANQLRLL